ncbi:hypothetical protein ACSTKY_11330 [Vibrio parahaemolyticus]
MDWLATNKDLVSVISDAIVAFGVLLVAMQVYFASKQIKTEHEKGRRLVAIQVVKDWNCSLNVATPAARGFVQELSVDQCKLLIKRESFNVHLDYGKFLKYALSGIKGDESELVIKQDQIQLTPAQISHLLALVIEHLNSLEVALLTWMNGVADKEIIESQFKYLVSVNNGHYVLDNLRMAMAGRGNYPAVCCFVKHLQKQSESNEPLPKSNVA